MTNATMKVLVAYDGSPSADAALEDLGWAGLPADTLVKVVTIADVWPYAPPEADATDSESLPAAVKMARLQTAQAIDNAHHLAEHAQAEIRRRFPHWQVEADAFADAPAWGIIKVADTWDADLIVMGTHGYSAIRRFVLGSVAQKVLTEARCSVRLARPHTRPAGSPLRIMVGVDGSAGASAAVQAIVARDWPPGSEVRVLAVVEDSPKVETATYLPSTLVAHIDNLSLTHAWVEPAIETATEELIVRGLTVTPLIVAGDPKETLRQEAGAWDADCVFVGANGTRRLNYIVLGSVSTAVAIHAPCSVEVIRQRQPQTQVIAYKP